MVNWKGVGIGSGVAAALVAVSIGGTLGYQSVAEARREAAIAREKPMNRDIPQVYLSLENLSATDGSSYHELLMADDGSPMEPRWGNHDVVLQVKPSPYLAEGDVLKIQPTPERTASVVDVRYSEARGKWQVVYKVSHDILVEGEKSITQQEEAEQAKLDQVRLSELQVEDLSRRLDAHLRDHAFPSAGGARAAGQISSQPLPQIAPDLSGRYEVKFLDSLAYGSRTELLLDDGRTVVITGYSGLNPDERVSLGSHLDAIGAGIRAGEKKVFAAFQLGSPASQGPDNTVRVTDQQGTVLRLFEEQQ